MQPTKREIDAALRSLETDPELAKLMDSAARGAHESRRLQWQAEVDECITRQQKSDERCGQCQYIESVKALGRQLATADNAFRREYHRAEVLKVKVENWMFAAVWLLFAVLGLVAKVLSWF